MKVRSGYPLKKVETLDLAIAYVEKIQKGGGRNSKVEMEIIWNPKVEPKAPLAGDSLVVSLPGDTEEEEEVSEGQWTIMAMNTEVVPGGSLCAQCQNTHFANDYICPDCRASL